MIHAVSLSRRYTGNVLGFESFDGSIRTKGSKDFFLLVDQSRTSCKKLRIQVGRIWWFRDGKDVWRDVLSATGSLVDCLSTGMVSSIPSFLRDLEVRSVARNNTRIIDRDNRNLLLDRASVNQLYIKCKRWRS